MGVDAKMVVVVPRPWSDDEIRKLAHDLCGAFGAERFWITPPDRHAAHRPILEEGETEPWYRTEDPLLPDERMIEISLAGRYWGPGYERGDFGFYYVLAEYLERKTEGKVYYGGDSGDTLERFDALAREKFMRHFLGPHARDYFTRDNPFMDPHEFADKPICRMCQVPMPRFGFGQDWAKYSCACGEHVERSSKGEERWHEGDRDSASMKRLWELEKMAREAFEAAHPAEAKELGTLRFRRT